jgi:WD40 repeat protein
MLWNTEDLTKSRKIVPSTKASNDSLHNHRVTFSRDGRTLASARETERITLWNVSDLQPIGNLYTNQTKPEKDLDEIQALSFSSDNQSIIASSESTVITWNLSKREKTSEVTPQDFGAFSTVAASSDGKFLVAGAWNEIVLWDLLSQKQWGSTIKGHSSTSFTLAFSMTGLLASGGDNGSIILWHVATQQRALPTLNGHSTGITSLVFSPDAKMLFSTDKTETTVLWDLDLQSWLLQACNIANRNFTKDEWKRYMGDEPYRKTCRPNDP